MDVEERIFDCNGCANDSKYNETQRPSLPFLHLIYRYDFPRLSMDNCTRQMSGIRSWGAIAFAPPNDRGGKNWYAAGTLNEDWGDRNRCRTNARVGLLQDTAAQMV